MTIAHYHIVQARSAVPMAGAEKFCDLGDCLSRRGGAGELIASRSGPTG